MAGGNVSLSLLTEAINLTKIGESGTTIIGLVVILISVIAITRNLKEMGMISFPVSLTWFILGLRIPEWVLAITAIISVVSLISIGQLTTLLSSAFGNERRGKIIERSIKKAKMKDENWLNSLPNITIPTKISKNSKGDLYETSIFKNPKAKEYKERSESIFDKLPTIFTDEEYEKMKKEKNKENINIFKEK